MPAASGQIAKLIDASTPPLFSVLRKLHRRLSRMGTHSRTELARSNSPNPSWTLGDPWADRLCGVDDQHRVARMAHDPFGHAAEHPPAHAGPAMGAHGDQGFGVFA